MFFGKLFLWYVIFVYLLSNLLLLKNLLLGHICHQKFAKLLNIHKICSVTIILNHKIKYFDLLYKLPKTVQKFGHFWAKNVATLFQKKNFDSLLRNWLNKTFLKIPPLQFLAFSSNFNQICKNCHLSNFNQLS